MIAADSMAVMAMPQTKKKGGYSQSENRFAVGKSSRSFDGLLWFSRRSPLPTSSNLSLQQRLTSFDGCQPGTSWSWNIHPPVNAGEVFNTMKTITNIFCIKEYHAILEMFADPRMPEEAIGAQTPLDWMRGLAGPCGPQGNYGKRMVKHQSLGLRWGSVS